MPTLPPSTANTTNTPANPNSSSTLAIAASKNISGATSPTTTREEDEEVSYTLLADKAATKLKTGFDMFINTQAEGFINIKGTLLLEIFYNLQIACRVGNIGLGSQ